MVELVPITVPVTEGVEGVGEAIRVDEVGRKRHFFWITLLASRFFDLRVGGTTEPARGTAARAMARWWPVAARLSWTAGIASTTLAAVKTRAERAESERICIFFVLWE